MADKIKVSAEAMRATVGKYQDSRSSMEDARKKLDSALQSLNGCWKGPAWVTMMAKWTEINLNITNSELAIERSIEGLNNTIQLYDTAEEQNTSKAKSQEVGTANTVFVE